MKLELLVFAAHPDDAELACGGTIIKHVQAGKKTAIVDLTSGDLGTRGSGELRLKEAAAASKVLGISVRENLGYADGFFQNDEAHQRGIIAMIRKYQPEIIICTAASDRHPDHGRAAQLVSDANFYSGLIKVETLHDGKNQPCWRAKAVYHTIQDRYMKPDFVIDISDVMDKKMKAIHAFKSQFYSEPSKEPVTPISTKEFIDGLFARATEYGRAIGVKYAEGFTTERIMGVKSLFDLK
ncbi:MAG: bacillithiol biosynthesis deacetylase BshB1 [Bacteroidota bacterium]